MSDNITMAADINPIILANPAFLWKVIEVYILTLGIISLKCNLLMIIDLNFPLKN